MVNDPCPFQGKGLSLGTVPGERAQDTWATARCSSQSPAPESRPQAQDWSCQRHPHRKAGSQSHAEALGLTTRWVQEQSHRRKPQKVGASFNPVTQNKTLPSTRLHTLPLYLECPSFSCPSGELLCILQGPVQMFLPLKPFLIKWCSYITPFGVWPSLFLPLPQCFLTLAPSNMIFF